MRNIFIVLVALGFSFSLFSEGDRPRGNYTSREMGFVGDTSHWWEVPNPPAIEIDPVITSVQLFWLDDQGYICKGNPGTTGQPGSIDLPYPASQELFQRSDSDGNVFISEEELFRFQTQRYPVSTSYDGLGEHLIIFLAHTFRVRTTGQLIEARGAQPSMPLDLMIDETFLVPGYFQPRSALLSLERQNCPLLDEMGVSIPPPPPPISLNGEERREESPQHPSRCLVRANITAQDLVRACQEGRLRGSLGRDGRLIIERPPPRSNLKKPGKKDIAPSKPKKKQRYL